MANKMDNDEVSALMQQHGISRVQATKMLYEITKQKKQQERTIQPSRVVSVKVAVMVVIFLVVSFYLTIFCRSLTSERINVGKGTC
jgi:quinol-cytochrome oxidoreductase complex cytochrome b subunit